MVAGSDLFRSTAGGLKRPKWLFLALAVAGFAASVGILGFTFSHHEYGLIAFAFQCALGGAMALRYGLSSLKGASFSGVSIAVGMDQSLRVDGRLVARRSELAQGFVVPTEAGTLVRLERKGLRPPLVLRVADEAEGERMLRALGFAAEHVSARMTVASSLIGMTLARQTTLLGLPALAVLGATVLALGGQFARRPQVGAALFFTSMALFLAYLFTIAFAPTSVSVGTDGILTRWLGWQRFFPFSAIRAVEVYEEDFRRKKQHGVRVELELGEVVKLPTGQTDIGAAEAKRLAHRISEARAARHTGAVDGAALPTVNVPLARGQRPLVEWVRDLRRLGAGVHDHRSPAVPVDALLRVVEDSRAPAAERAGAALAAMASPNADAKWRVHVAAATTVSPKLRLSLTRIAEGSAEDADEALAPLLGGLEELEAEHR